ncbi:MAG: ABC transporter substrate-binding protein [Gillisia sp.]
MFRVLVPILLSFFLLSCNSRNKKESDSFQKKGDTLEIKYAQGFSVVDYKSFKILKVRNPWPGADKTFTYLLYRKGAQIPPNIEYDQKVEIPVKKIVLTSTTQIPSLEALEKENTLVGFPGLNYISSKKTRKRIEEGKVHELGKNEDINTEVLIAQHPDVVIGFAVNGNNKSLQLVQKTGIPVVFDGDWVEESPLGKAEWIKFFGAFYNKSAEAEHIFNEIAQSYHQAKELAKLAPNSPSVLSGSVFKDQWFVPYGNSWQAQFIKDANANYIFKNTHGHGSRSLAFETVLNTGQKADFWIAPGQFKSYSQLLQASPHYKEFKAVQNHKVFTYSNTTGKTGGVLYYELAPSRPDLVLKDLIHIFHPDILPDYNPVFFTPLKK